MFARLTPVIGCNAGLDQAQLALVPTNDVTFTNDTTPEPNPGAQDNNTVSG